MRLRKLRIGSIMDKAGLYEIYLFKVTFHDKTGGKERPVVTISYNQRSLSFELLGIYSDRPKYSKKVYYQDFMYQIKDYQAAGLRKISWINVRQPIIVPFTVLMGKELFGKLSQRDTEELVAFYDRYWQNHGGNTAGNNAQNRNK